MTSVTSESWVAPLLKMRSPETVAAAAPARESETELSTLVSTPVVTGT